MTNSRNADRVAPRRTLAAMLIAAAAATTALTPIGAAAQTFAETLEMTLDGSPLIEAQREVIRGLDETVAAARAGMRPTIAATGSAGATYTDSSAGAPGGGEVGGTGSVPLSLTVTGTQRLYDGGATSSAVESAYALVVSARFTLIDIEQQVLLEAVTAYVTVVQAQQNLRLANNNVEVVGRQLTAARDRFDVGEVTRTDVAQAEAQLAESQSNLVTRRGELRAAQQTFLRIVGMAPGHLGAVPRIPELPATLEEAVEIAEQRHPAILAARAAVESAQSSVEQSLAALGPSVQLDGSAGVSETLSAGDSTSVVSGSTTLSVTVPIYSGGASRAGVRQAQALEDQRFHELRNTTRLIREAVGLAWVDLATTRAIIRSARERVRAEQVAFEGVQEEARVGSRTTLDVLEAEQDLLDARVALVTAQSNEHIAAYTLLSALGLLSSETLQLDVETYDAAALYEASQEVYAGVEEEEGDEDWQNNWRD